MYLWVDLELNWERESCMHKTRSIHPLFLESHKVLDYKVNLKKPGETCLHQCYSFKLPGVHYFPFFFFFFMVSFLVSSRKTYPWRLCTKLHSSPPPHPRSHVNKLHKLKVSSVKKLQKLFYPPKPQRSDWGSTSLHPLSKNVFLWSHFESRSRSRGSKVEREKDSWTSFTNKPLPSRPELPPCCEPC